MVAVNHQEKGFTIVVALIWILKFRKDCWTAPKEQKDSP